MIHSIAHIDRAKHPPTIVGAFGAAWEIDIAAVQRRFPNAHATVCAWCVFAPWAHLCWSYYSLGAVHLRPIEGGSRAIIHLPGATHEVICNVLSPDRAPDLEDPMSTALRPTNVAGQWIVSTRPNPGDQDKAAAAKIRGCVDEILAGVLSPDTDFRHEWIKRFSASNVRP